MVQFQLERTRKKYGLSMQVLDGGIVHIKAGYGISNEDISAFINSHKRWIKVHVDKVLKLDTYREKYLGGDVVLLHGKDVPVKYLRGDGHGEFDGEVVTIYSLNDSKKYLDKWRFDYAKKYLIDMFKRYAGDVCKVNIKRVKTYYGICYNKMGKDSYINLNADLIGADDECIRYVIHHEITHLKVPNHSKRFYDELAILEPDYVNIRARLRNMVKSV